VFFLLARSGIHVTVSREAQSDIGVMSGILGHIGTNRKQGQASQLDIDYPFRDGAAPHGMRAARDAWI
jgi:hypothetical protein